MTLRTCALLALASLSGCDAISDLGGSGLGGGAGMHDVDDVSGDEMLTDEREIDRATDTAESGLRFSDDGTVAAGGTEEGEIVDRGKPTDVVEDDMLVPPVELPDEPL